MEKRNIKLADFIDQKETALVGRPNGEELLKNFENKKIIFKDIEKQVNVIEIEFPGYIVTINKSFFLGWLETRIIELGKKNFIKKYDFIASDHIKNRISQYIDAALLNATQEEILDV